MRTQDVLAAAGPQAQHIEALWWLMLVICTVVFIAVLIGVALALIRLPRGDPATPPDLSSLARPERSAAIVVVAAVAVSAALLVFLTIASYLTDSRLARLSPPALEVEGTVRRWSR